MPAEHMQKIFGMHDAYVKKLERDFGVAVIDRNGSITITGSEEMARKAENVLRELALLSGRGNEIEEQSVDYAITLGMEKKEGALTEIDTDCICHTVNGKPIKPKTLGQKAYVDAIRENMLVFSLGPAGTGKTYTLTQRIVACVKKVISEEDRVADPMQCVLAITFTNKAAEELRSRVRSALLVEAAQSGDMRLRECALNVDNAWISTIHAMASRILKENALEFGIDPSFELLSEDGANAIFENFFNKKFKKEMILR